MTATIEHTDQASTEHATTENVNDEHAAEPRQIGRIIELSPKQVAQHPDNIRDASRDISALAASIKEFGGIQTPLTVVPVALVSGHEFEPHITHVAVDGNRRQRAAAQLGMMLPCIERPDVDDARSTVQTMLVTALTPNRLTAAEEAHGLASLFDLKMSATAIGRLSGRTRSHVNAARKAATLRPEFAPVAADYSLTMDQLAVIAEFQDNPEAVQMLTDAAADGSFEHRAALLRATITELAAVAAKRAELAKQGITVLDDEPGGEDTDTPRKLFWIRAADARSGDTFTKDTHAACPGHAAYVTADFEPGNPFEDWEDTTDVRVTYVCTDPEGYGHLYRFGSQPEPVSADDVDQDDPEARRQAAEARAAAEQAEAEQKASASQARRDLIRRNKEADAAEGVRREFLRQSFGTKARHKAMTDWALTQLVKRDSTYARYVGAPAERTPILAGVLGDQPAKVFADAPASKNGLHLWAHLVTAYEEEFARDSHRANNYARAQYLQHLQAIGYGLADVEQLVIENAAPPRALRSVFAAQVEHQDAATDQTQPEALAEAGPTETDKAGEDVAGDDAAPEVSPAA